MDTINALRNSAVGVKCLKHHLTKSNACRVFNQPHHGFIKILIKNLINIMTSQAAKRVKNSK